MKKTAFALLFALATTTGFAQVPGAQKPSAGTLQAAPTLAQRAEAMTASMVKNLRLTPEQAAKVQAINLTSITNAEAAKKKYKADPRKIVAQIDIISQTRLSQIKDILTPVQFQQYQQHREEKMGVPQEAQSNPEARQRSPLNQENN
ncbi:hypothetical protein [Pontibacter liquoris]|uniref:hypothetical protein n=1 Tax=Pontibacter liquoris TaxID=2905677 RepID=UPI001FA71546|nr:hypothetical protein [Pontibacter liquoris]